MNRIEIRNLKDDMERIDFQHLETCAHCGHTTTQDVTIFRPHFEEFGKCRTPWTVTFSGAVDFEGNKKDMLKRYPEFKNITCDLK